jgi:iron-sulfur cluster assembly protein
MALDEPKDNDDVYDVKGHKLVVDKEFMKEAQTIKVDFSGMGFKIDSKINFDQSDCGSCGTEGTCCS